MVSWCGIEPDLADLGGQRACLEGWVEQADRRQVDGEPARRTPVSPRRDLEPADPLEDRRDDVDVELDAAIGADGGLHDRADRLRQHRHVRPEQALVFVQRPGRQRDDRLERDPVELPQAEEIVEHLGLDDLGRLGHPDPVGQPGQLDRGRHGDQVAIALGERAVHRDQPVVGRIGGLGDRRGQAVGQVVGRPDQDGARIELDQAPAVDERREAAHEPDVARPQQALVGATPWR